MGDDVLENFLRHILFTPLLKIGNHDPGVEISVLRPSPYQIVFIAKIGFLKERRIGNRANGLAVQRLVPKTPEIGSAENVGIDIDGLLGFRRQEFSHVKPIVSGLGDPLIGFRVLVVLTELRFDHFEPVLILFRQLSQSVLVGLGDIVQHDRHIDRPGCIFEDRREGHSQWSCEPIVGNHN